MPTKELSLKSLVGGGYKGYWNALHDPNKRYLAIKGSRASKKSKTTAMFLILLLMENPKTNALVMRQYANTLRDSCFQDLQWSINRLGFESDFICTVSPLMIRRESTGQKILFRGLDEGTKVTSITVSKGVLAYVWLEEAYELKSESEFNKVDLSFRGQMPTGITAKFMFTFNPWSDRCWLKGRFFDKQAKNIYSNTTNYTVNEWLSPTDIELFESMRRDSPRRYKIEGLGEWGIAEGLIYENVECRELDINALKSKLRYKAIFGLDFGFTDPTAFVGAFIDNEAKEIYIYYELYLNNVTNQDIARQLKDIGLHGEPVYCDAAEPKSIEELRRCGINAKAAIKGPDSVKFGIQKLQNYKIIYDPRCENFGHEIENYCWEKDAKGNSTDKPNHEYSHLMDALRYALSTIKVNNLNHINKSNLTYMKVRRR